MVRSQAGGSAAPPPPYSGLTPVSGTWPEGHGRNSIWAGIFIKSSSISLEWNH